MKKLIALILSIVSALTVFAFSACGNSAEISLKYYADASELMPALKSGEIAYGILAEPAATTLENTTKGTKIWYRLDIQELYDAETKSYPQAVMLVKESLLNTNATLVNSIADKFAENVEWATANPAQAATAVNSVLPEGATPSLKPAALTSNAVVNCNIRWQGAQEAASAVKNYLNTIIDIEKLSANPAADDLFYDGTATGDFTEDTVKVYAPDGAPALAIAKFINENETFGTDKTFEYNVVKAENIGEIVIKGTGDIVILPVNAASKLYKKNTADPYKLVSVLTHGNLYLMCSEEITVDGLKDKTIGVFNMGGVPDLTFRAVLNKIGYKFEISK